jgi:hypothetical protein
LQAPLPFSGGCKPIMAPRTTEVSQRQRRAGVSSRLFAHRKRTGMPDDPKDTIEFAIRSAFVSYPKEDDPDWRSPHWITGKETAYLAMAIILEAS